MAVEPEATGPSWRALQAAAEAEAQRHFGDAAPPIWQPKRRTQAPRGWRGVFLWAALVLFAIVAAHHLHGLGVFRADAGSVLTEAAHEVATARGAGQPEAAAVGLQRQVADAGAEDGESAPANVPRQEQVDLKNPGAQFH